MKLKFALPILILGFFLIMFGALFKLESWEGASEMLIAGMVMCVAAVAMLLSKPRVTPENKNGPKFRTPILIIASGLALLVFGALAKLESWGYASEMLMLGNLLQLIGAVILVFRAVLQRRK